MAWECQRSITLVHACAPATLRRVQAALREIGDLVVPAELGAWLDGISPGRCLLLLDGTCDRALQAGIRERLLARPFPVLGIFPGFTDPFPDLAQLCTDFLVWPCTSAELDVRMRHLRSASKPGPSASLQEELELRDMLDTRMVGQSEAFRRMQRQIRKIAACDAHVLIEGETGTGKELAAHAIHYLGKRTGQPFIPVNCGALPDELFENELFGHESGAYTDARKAQSGLVRQADGGTLFLDEVDSLTPRAQVGLLRFLQDLRYRPLGSEHTRIADVRVVAAGNRSLAGLVAAGQYRQDLYFRLHIMHLAIPPLRDRPEDIERLVEHFIAGLRARHDQPEKYLPRHAVAWLLAQPWPGNARELENVITREFLMAEEAEINLQGMVMPDGGPSAEELGTKAADFSTAKCHAMDAFETSYLRSVLRRARGNVSEAARLAGKERRAFGKLMKKHGIARSEFARP